MDGQNVCVPVPIFQPMLATGGVARNFSSSEDWRFEPKLDGWRALVTLDDGRLTVRTRNGRHVTSALPELTGLADALAGRTAVLDGELIAGAGRAEDFYS